MPKTLTDEHIAAMQEGRRRAKRERPKEIREQIRKLEMQRKESTDPSERGRLIREIAELGVKLRRYQS